MLFNQTFIKILCYFLVFALGMIVGMFSYRSIYLKRSIINCLIYGILFELIFIKYKFSYHTIEYFVVLFIIVYIFWSDFLMYTIPNIYIVIGLANRLIFILLFENNINNLLNSIFSGIGIALPLMLLSVLMSQIFKKEMMGGGDIKLLFMFGTYFNIYKNVFALLVSSLLALIYIIVTNKKDSKIAFGTFICIANYLLIFIE